MVSRARICCYYEAPPYEQGNKFILRGYRRNFTKMDCLKSIFLLSNESVNIWSHLLGALWFLYTIVNMNFYVLPSYKFTTWYDHVITTLFSVAIMLCLLFSALFHMLRCHSSTYFDFWYKMDLLGIEITFIASCMSAMYYSFTCFKLLRIFYMTTFTGLLMLNLYIQTCSKGSNNNTTTTTVHNKGHSNTTTVHNKGHNNTTTTVGNKGHNNHTTPTTAGVDFKAVFGFSAVMSFTFLPAVHWFIITGGFKSTVSCTAFFNLLVMYFLAGTGLLVYLARIPEKWFPGYFDYVGASHQIWHMLILFALMWWYSSCYYIIDLYLSGKMLCQEYQ